MGNTSVCINEKCDSWQNTNQYHYEIAPPSSDPCGLSHLQDLQACLFEMQGNATTSQALADNVVKILQLTYFS